MIKFKSKKQKERIQGFIHGCCMCDLSIRELSKDLLMLASMYELSCHELYQLITYFSKGTDEVLKIK